MVTIGDRLDYLEGTRAAIEGAMVGNGVEVPQGVTFRGLAGLMESQMAGIDRMASPYAAVKEGNPVTVRGVPGSTMKVTASVGTTVAYEGVAYPVQAGAPLVLKAGVGVSTVSAASGTVLVEYHRESMDVLSRLTLPVTGAGLAARVSGCMDDLPLGVTARILATQAGTGVQSPENVRGIAGVGSVHLGHCGVNLLELKDGDVVSGYYYDGGGAASGAKAANIRIVPKRVAPGAKYTLSCNLNLYSIWGSAGMTGDATTAIGTYATNKATFTVPAGCYYIRVSLRNTSGEADITAFQWAQLEPGTVATAYQPYVGREYSVTLPETVYGITGLEGELKGDGVLAVRTGYNTVTTQTITTPGLQANPAYCCFYIVMASGALTYGAILCSHFPTVNRIYSSTAIECVGTLSDGKRVYFCMLKSRFAGWDDAWSDAQKTAAAKAWFAAQASAGTPVQIVYEKAAVRELAVSPLVMPSLAGVNTVWADGGGEVTLTGRQDLAGALASRDQAIVDLQNLTTSQAAAIAALQAK